MFSARLLRTLLTSVETACSRSSTGSIGPINGSAASESCISRSSQTSQRSGGKITGIRE